MKATLPLIILAAGVLCFLNYSVEQFSIPYLISPNSWWSTNVSHIQTNAYFFWHNRFALKLNIIFCVISFLVIMPQLILGHRLQQAPLQLLAIFTLLHLLGVDFLVFYGILCYLLLQYLISKQPHPLYLLFISAALFFISGPTLLLWIILLLLEQPDRCRKMSLLHVALPALVLALVYPPPSFPDYPQGAMLVVDDGIPGLLRPYWGALSPNLQIINRLEERRIWRIPCWVLLLGFSFLGLQKKRIAVVLPAIILGFDILTPEEIAHISPLAVIRRVVPYAFFLPLPSLMISYLISRLAFSEPKESSTTICVLTLTSLLLLSDKFSPLNESEGMTASPSLHTELFERTGLTTTETLRDDPLIPPERYSVTTNLKGDISTLSDRRKATKIFSSTQQGNEFIKIDFLNEHSITGIILSSGHFYTDYPRYISVEDCHSNRTIVPPTLWLGSLEKTESGHLYHDAQTSKEQRLHFEAPVKTCCILIKQVGRESYFDWSVAELRVFGKDP